MQTISDEWPSLTRMLSCRHSKKVSCETLSLIDDGNLQIEAHSFYYSDDEKDHRKEEPTIADYVVSELENPSYGYRNLANAYLQRARELEKHSGKLDNPSHADGKAAGHKFLARFLSKTSHMPAARRAKEVERLRKHLQAYPSAIHGTGGVSQSGPILLNIGSHSSSLSSKAPTTLRASSIIPRNAVAGKMNPSGAAEPSSPKVTCLGRVRNQQKHIGKCTSVVDHATKEDQLDVCCRLMLKRREKKKADTEVVKSVKEKKTSRMGSGNAMVVDHCVEQSKETDCEKSFKKLTAQKSGGKGTVSSRYVAKEENKRWSLRETTKHEERKTSYQHQQKWQAKEASALGASSPEAELPMDLSRFGSEESQKGHEMMVANSVTSMEGNDSQRFEPDGTEDFVRTPPRNALLLIRNRKAKDNPGVSLSSSSSSLSNGEGNDSQRFEQDGTEDFMQTPPRNALLLIRNRKAKDNPEVSLTSSSSSLSNGQETKLPTALGDHVSTLFSMSTSMPHECDQFLQPLRQVEMKKPVTIADILGHVSSPMTLKMENASAMACKSDRFQNKFSLQEGDSGVHRQASLPKSSPEVRLWQRRAIEKPCALDLNRPVKSEINRRTTV